MLNQKKMDPKPKQKKQSSNEIVYKCNSKHCKENGFHNKDEMRTITLKLTVGSHCPLDFEDAPMQVVSAPRTNGAVGNNITPGMGEVPTQTTRVPKKSVVPQALLAQGLQMRPPKE